MSTIGTPLKRSHYYRTHRPKPSMCSMSLSERSRQGFRRYVIKDTETIEQKLKKTP